MPEAIVISLITNGVLLLGYIISAIVTTKKTKSELQSHAQQTRKEADEQLGKVVDTFKAQYDKTVALMEYKLDELTKQVEKHNSIIERTFALEKAMSVVEERQKTANHRIDDLEEVVEKERDRDNDGK